MDDRYPMPTEWQRIVLTGFMGSGKTTVGRALAARLRWSFLDLDEAVHRREGLSVPAIFEQRGEPAFRHAEVQTLQELLTQSRVVIALGGGAPESLDLQDLLSAADATVVVHLQAPFNLLYERCLGQAQIPGATARPLLGTRDEASERYIRRLAVYAKVAHHTSNAAAFPEDVVDDILSRL